MVEIYYQNVRGLKTKRSKISGNILQNNYNIIAFTETWLNSNIENREIIDSRYTVYRKDRPRSGLKTKLDGGGVLLAVSKHISSVRMTMWENEQETLWVILQLKIGEAVKKIALCVVYLPPPVKLESLESFLSSVGIVVEEKRNVIVLGDLNLGPSVQHGTNTSLQTRYMKLRFALTNFISQNRLSQVNAIINSDKRLLDLVITNITNVQVNKTASILSKIDKRHPNLLININF